MDADDFLPAFQLDHSQMNYASLNAEWSVAPMEVDSAFADKNREIDTFFDPFAQKYYYICIGFSRQRRFILIALDIHPTDDDKLVVVDVLVSNERQIRSRYYVPKFR